MPDFELTLNSPITEEQWDMLTDVDFDKTDRIWFYTKHGKTVEFRKVKASTTDEEDFHVQSDISELEGDSGGEEL